MEPWGWQARVQREARPGVGVSLCVRENLCARLCVSMCVQACVSLCVSMCECACACM